MKLLRKSYWYISVFFQKHWIAISGAVVGSVLLFQFLSTVVFSNITDGKQTRYVGRVGNISLATLPLDIQEKISDGLTSLGKDTSILPALAERWSVEDDGRTYRFVLKKKVLWQDGKELTTDDISYNFSDAQVITNQNEVIFKLKEPFSPFPSIVSQPIFREQKNTILGIGNYRIKKIKRDGTRILELVLESDNEKIIYRFYPTEDNVITAFKNGEVDIIEDMTKIGNLSGWKNVKVTEDVRHDRYLAIFFNMGDGSFDKNTRQALNYAIPKAKGEERALSPINPKSWAYNKTVKTYEDDLERAVELLLRSIPERTMTIELTTTANFQDTAELIKRDWEELGRRAQAACETSKEIKQKTNCPNVNISVTLHLVGFPDLSNFQTVLVGQQIPPDPDQYSLWHSTQNTNFTRYKSPRVDKLLEDGRKTVDKEERKTIYLDFQQFLVEDTPAIFLNHLKFYTVERI